MSTCAYEPLRVFSALAAVLGVLALAAFVPFLSDWILNGDTTGHVQSLIIGAVLALAAVQVLALGIVADALAANRAISQRIHERVRRLELEAGVPPSHYEPGGFDTERGAGAGDEAPGRDAVEL